MILRNYADDITQQVAALLTIPIASMAADAPGGGDIYAMVGALIAAVCTLFNAQEAKRTKLSQATVFIGSATVGCIGPGVTVSFMLWKGWIAYPIPLTWHGWAGLGLMFGLSGWGALHTVLKAISNFVEARAAALIPNRHQCDGHEHEEHHKPD
jgi:hypothetical protein